MTEINDSDTKWAISFKQRCESIATERRTLLGLRAYDRLPADLLAYSMNARLFTPENARSAYPKDADRLLNSTDTWSAAIFSYDPLCILYNPEHSHTRYEADIMHEIAHKILQHPLQSVDPATDLFRFISRYEDEAKYLGSCLQIPRRGLLWAIQKKMSRTEIAAHFGASEAMVQFRMNMTGASNK